MNIFNKIKHYAKELITFVILLTVLSNGVSYYKSLNLNKNSLTLNELTLLDNTKYNFPKDKAVMVHFWATWCPICKIEASNIQNVSKDYEVITIAVESNNIVEYLKEQNVSFKVHHDVASKLAQKFKIEVYPTTLIFDKNQKLVFSDVGYTSTLGLSMRMWWANL